MLKPTFNTNYIAYLLALGLCLASTQMWAADLPSYYPERFDNIGHVQNIDIADRTVVIDDLLLFIPDDTPVNTQRSQNALISSLREGTRVGFTLTHFNQRPVLTEAWVLPESMDILDKSDDE